MQETNMRFLRQSFWEEDSQDTLTAEPEAGPSNVDISFEELDPPVEKRPFLDVDEKQSLISGSIRPHCVNKNRSAYEANESRDEKEKRSSRDILKSIEKESISTNRLLNTLIKEEARTRRALVRFTNRNQENPTSTTARELEPVEPVLYNGRDLTKVGPNS